MAQARDGADEYWLSYVVDEHRIRRLVDITMMRWRIERDYQDLKQEVGLGHFEGRGWRGFHHHATMCIAAYGFLISERGAIPPSERALRNSPPATCPSPGLQTPRRRRCGLSGTFPTPSPACDAVSSPASHEHCHDVPVVPPKPSRKKTAKFVTQYD